MCRTLYSDQRPYTCIIADDNINDEKAGTTDIIPPTNYEKGDQTGILPYAIGLSVLGAALVVAAGIGIFCGVKYSLRKRRYDETTSNTNKSEGAADTTHNEHASGYSQIDLSDINTTPSSYDTIEGNTTEYAEIH